MFLQILAIVLILFILNHLLIRLKFLLDLSSKFSHKRFVKTQKVVPLSGGLVLFLIVSYFNFQDYIFVFSLLFLLILGISSDIDFLRSPKIRILFQILILTFYVILSQNYFSDLRLDSLNHILSFYFLAISINIFCFLVLINGTNLIDGLNSITIGYYLSISLILLYLKNNFNLYFDINFLINITLALSILYLFNVFGKIFMGDNGSYLISFIFGSFLINLYIQNPSVSPYFIMCLLWYPAFENLFSIIRKSVKKISFQTPDNNHLHQLLYKFFEKKMNLNKKIINSLTGNVIVFYNLIYFYLIKDLYFFTSGLIISVFINIIVYSIIYSILSKKLNTASSSNN